MSRGPQVRTPEDRLWKPKRSIHRGPRHSQSGRRRRHSSVEAERGIRQGQVLVLLAGSVLLLAFFLSGADLTNRRSHAVTLPVEEQYSEEEQFGPEARSAGHESTSSGHAADAEAAPDLTMDVNALGRELLLKVLESDEEDTKELVTPRFLEDLEYNRAVLRSADLENLEVERQGTYWIQGKTPYHLPPPTEGVPGKAGVAQLRMVFMDGRWKLHELGLSVQ